VQPIPVNFFQLRSACSTCSLHELCLPAGLDTKELTRLDVVVSGKRSLKRGQYLYRAGSASRAIYAVRRGFMRSSVLHDGGREQVMGFHMLGELLGMDSIGSAKHTCDAIALEDTDICEIPFDDLERLSRDMPTLQRHFHNIMSREIAHDYGVMLLLGSMRAEERLATFILNLSQRLGSRGYSPTRFNLRMTRDDIGSYLGLKLETVSRMFSRFQSDGLITVKNRSIDIIDMPRLRALLGQCGTS